LSGAGTLERWKDSLLYQSLIGVYYEANLDFSQVPEAVHESMRQYRALLHELRYLDYTGIMHEAVHELETNSVLQAQLAGAIRHVVVDEYQDVNPLQERLIRRLFELGAKLCVVGDDDQTIYQWRGSEVANILKFARHYPDVELIRLNENFRSSHAVVDSARETVERNPERLDKRMESTAAQPFTYGDVLALTFDGVNDEAAWIAAKIAKLHGTEYVDRRGQPPRGLAFNDCAILLRSVRADAAPITAALEKAGIPYVVTGMNRLFETPEVAAMAAVFAYLADPEQDQTEVAAALQIAALGLSPAQLAQGLSLLAQRKQLIAPNNFDVQIHLQRLYLDLLEALQLREDAIPTANGRTGEIVFYNLGKFSQVITDYEQIHYKSAAPDLYQGFAGFLTFQASGYYPEGWEEAGITRVDAVQILTVHRAKGMQWPCVFVPALRQNRYPSRRQGGRSVWHVIPETAVSNVDRYKGTVEDERRLFYVALTRAERYLFCSWAPIPTNRQQLKQSVFLKELTACDPVLTSEPRNPVLPPKLTPRPRHADETLSLSFSELKYYFECPYSFKLRFLYGFNEPVSQAIGYGKSLHDALAQIHAESLRGHVPTPADVPDLVNEHLHLPFANAQTREYLERAAHLALSQYLITSRKHLDKLEHVEKTIELKLGDGIVVNGRIDLIRRTDTGQLAVVDFKSTDRAQTEEVTRRQLQVYALGYEQLTGQSPHLIEVHNLDDGKVHRELVDRQLIAETGAHIVEAGGHLRQNHLPRLTAWCSTCGECNFVGICRSQ
jgi:DNA helicase-2/ATP-dependent DNA helicase PcrA